MKVLPVLYGAAVAGLLCGAWAAPAWKWDGRAHLVGNRLVERHEVARLLPQPGKPLYLLDPAALERAVERLPAVKDARVRRWGFPPRLEIALTERVAVARLAGLATGSPPVFLDADGFAFGFSSASIPVPPLQVVAGARSLTAPQREGFRHVAAAWPSGRAGTIDVRSASSWRATIGGIPVLIGPPAELPAKFRALSRLLPLAEGTRKTLEYVDVRFPDAPAFRVATRTPAQTGQNEQGLAVTGHGDLADHRRAPGHTVQEPGRLRQAEPAQPPRRGPGADAQPVREAKGRSGQGGEPVAGAPRRSGERPAPRQGH
ncbi:MAG: FtsQ-type POTRA domain-containing protein [Candidatus Sericytochromatia bacterium]|nr:FtsQ-type POTRA domain-containing protein [Candidatus Tanganyikabacteria bacterium]